MASVKIMATPETRHIAVENALTRFGVMVTKLGVRPAVKALKWIAIYGPTADFETMRDALVAKFQALPAKASEASPGDNTNQIVTILQSYRTPDVPLPTAADIEAP